MSAHTLPNDRIVTSARPDKHTSASPFVVSKLRCFKQALLALAHLRKNETFAQVGAGFGVSEATAWRYVDETLEVLAAWAPGLHEALVGLGEGDFVIVDGSSSRPTASRRTSRTTR